MSSLLIFFVWLLSCLIPLTKIDGFMPYSKWIHRRPLLVSWSNKIWHSTNKWHISLYPQKNTVLGYGSFTSVRFHLHHHGFLPPNIRHHSRLYHQKKGDPWSELESVPRNLLQTLTVTALIPEILKDKNRVTIMLCVSGGCDSIALFHSFMKIVDQQDDGSFTISDSHTHRISCDLHIIHFDHQQRGTSSDGDRLFVQELCLQYGIPFYSYFWNDSQSNMVRNDTKPFSQEVARDWRRHTSVTLMKEIKSHQGLGMICTAHHRDDFEETMIMKMLRGVHITNISGMDVLSESNEDGIYFVKPLLNIRKRELEDFLLTNGQSWREDESNKSDKYLRNRVRNELMPLLHDLIGGESVLSHRLNNIQNQSSKVHKDVTSRAKRLLEDMHQGTDVDLFVLPDKLNTLDLVHEEALFLWAKSKVQSNIPITYEKVVTIGEQIKNFPSKLKWKLSVGDGWEVERNGSVLKLNHTRGISSSDAESSPFWSIIEHGSIRNNENIHAVTVSIKIKLDSSKTLVVKKSKDVATSKFRPKWRTNNMKLTDFLRGQKVPLHLRHDVPVICSEINGAMTVIAVFVQIKDENQEGSLYNGKWHIHGDYIVTEDDMKIKYREVELCYQNK